MTEEDDKHTYILPENPEDCSGVFSQAIVDFSRKHPGKTIVELTRNGRIAGFDLTVLEDGVETRRALTRHDFINTCYSVGTWYYCVWMQDKDGRKIKVRREGLPEKYIDALFGTVPEDTTGVEKYSIDEPAAEPAEDDEDKTAFIAVVAFVLGILAVGAVYVVYHLFKERCVEVELING